ncbi:putative membrane protein [Salmonella phage P46FS4]|uniref:Putative membrane protein n=1 Tax=Salmonella phage P46FS4 TaxID=2712940 RepID=A0A6G6XTX8_9CAUD|nr:hypothetical protein HYQ39_gp135 [Salmonella phage P46FS4]QIG62201.1 putative membrane protein [Salmonella phage P46FS4]
MTLEHFLNGLVGASPAILVAIAIALHASGVIGVLKSKFRKESIDHIVSKARGRRK